MKLAGTAMSLARASSAFARDANVDMTKAAYAFLAFQTPEQKSQAIFNGPMRPDSTKPEGLVVAKMTVDQQAALVKIHRQDNYSPQRPRRQPKRRKHRDKGQHSRIRRRIFSRQPS